MMVEIQHQQGDSPTQEGTKAQGSWGRALGIWALNALSITYVAPKISDLLQNGPESNTAAAAPFDPERREGALVDPDRIAYQQFINSPSALMQFERDARFSLLTAAEQFRPASLQVSDPRRQQLDVALNEARGSYQFTQPELSLSQTLRAFQSFANLRADGVYGPATRAALIHALYGDGEGSAEAFFQNEHFAALRGVSVFRPEQRSEGDPARRALKTALDVAEERAPFITFTGERLQAFQAAHGLRADGEFGSLTRFALARTLFREPELADAVAERCGIQEGSAETFNGFINHLIEREGGAGAVQKLRSEDPEVRRDLLINDPNDPGGITFCGITLNDYRQRVDPEATSASLVALTYEDVRNYYYSEYFQRQNLAELPPAVAYICSDAAVNHGAGRLGRFSAPLGLPELSRMPEGALPYVQRRALSRLADPTVLNASGAEALVEDLFQLRIGLYEELRPELRTRYMSGWLNRLRDVNTFLTQERCYGNGCHERVAGLIQAAEEREQARRAERQQ